MNGNRIAKYINFVIPEVAANSSYFLLAAFSDKCVRLFGEGPVRVAPQENYDIAILPHFAIADVMDSSVDVCYNSRSLSEWAALLPGNTWQLLSAFAGNIFCMRTMMQN
jgi:hypothetical protein